MHYLDSRRKNTILAISITVVILAIPFLAPKQPSVEIDALLWAMAMILTGTILCFLPSYTNRHTCIFFGVFIWLIFGVGFSEFAAILLWLLSAWSLGVLVLRRVQATEDLALISTTEALLIGSSIWLAILGGISHFSVNYQLLHIALCLLLCLPLASRLSAVHNEFRSRVDAAQDWMQSIPFWAWVAGLTIIGWVLRWTSFPTMGYDDHALHLRAWTEFLTQQHYEFDIHAQIWAMAPFVVDLLHAVLSLIAGNDARGAINLTLAIFIFLLMARIFHIWKITGLAQWLLIVLMASTPMLGNLLLSLQTELMLAVLALAGMRLIIDTNEGWRSQHVLGVLSCAALCAGTKLPGAVLGMTFLLILVERCWSWQTVPTRPELKLRWSALWVLIPLIFVALHSYTLAWKVTGNPVFPLYNAIFRSPFSDLENFSDNRWIHGFSFLNYFRAFFYTSEFFEAGNYTAGWQYLFLLPIAIFASLRPGLPNGLRIALVPLFGFGLAMFSATQYWRYLFPVMPIAGLLLATFFIKTNKRFQRIIVALTIVCVVLNMVFFPKISWMMGYPASKAVTNHGKKSIKHFYAPATLLTEKINMLGSGYRVLYPPYAPYGATLHGSPLYVNGYSRLRAARFESLETTKDIDEFLSQENVDFVITDMHNSRASGSPEALLREYLARFGSVIAQEGNFLLYRVSESPILYRKVFDLDSSIEKKSDEIKWLQSFPDGSIQVSNEPKHLATVQVYRAKQARYSVDFNCQSKNGFFVAQINWDRGEAYYRLIACESNISSFVEAFPIPVGATTGIIYVTARNSESVNIKKISVEIH